MDLQPATGSAAWGLFPRLRFYLALGGCVVVTALGFFWGPLMTVGLVLATAVFAAAVVEYVTVGQQGRHLTAARDMEKRLHLGDENPIRVRVAHGGKVALRAVLVEELPVQFQERDFQLAFEVAPGQTRLLNYKLRPTQRGVYTFGRMLMVVRTALGLVERRYAFGAAEQSVAVYPSVLQMRRQALRVNQLLRRGGSTVRQRQLGRSYEFDQIKTYVAGDDYRQLNWKATARTGQLMANTFVEEKSQQVIAVVDTSRTMLSPFDDLSLLDYAINSTLALLNVAVMRGDRVGLIGFDRQVHSRLAPGNRPEQIRRVLELLYAQRPTDYEPDYDALGQFVQRFVKGRSLLMLYTDFGTLVSLERNLPALRRLSRQHLLVVVLFVNVGVGELAEATPRSLEDAYLATVAAEYEATQGQIASTLTQNGIVVLRTRPQDLTADAVTNYLTIKRGGRL